MPTELDIVTPDERARQSGIVDSLATLPKSALARFEGITSDPLGPLCSSNSARRSVVPQAPDTETNRWSSAQSGHEASLLPATDPA